MQVGSLSVAEMLYRTNLVAMVAGGRKPKFADNSVMVYDDAAQKMVGHPDSHNHQHQHTSPRPSPRVCRCWSSPAPHLS